MEGKVWGMLRDTRVQVRKADVILTTISVPVHVPVQEAHEASSYKQSKSASGSGSGSGSKSKSKRKRTSIAAADRELNMLIKKHSAGCAALIFFPLGMPVSPVDTGMGASIAQEQEEGAGATAGAKTTGATAEAKARDWLSSLHTMTSDLPPVVLIQMGEAGQVVPTGLGTPYVAPVTSPQHAAELGSELARGGAMTPMVL
jgi:hypothetical protein